jgi:hypothetical protein
VIAIDRKVRTRWGALGVASYNEDMVDLVATMHNLTKVRTDLNSARGLRAGDGGGGGGGGDVRYVKKELDEQKPKRATKACWVFNRPEGCTRQGCRFPHVCEVCGSKAHGKHDCKNKK